MGPRNGKNTGSDDSARNSYTQGPFDETFGQHGAFGVQDGDPLVLEYLRSVREEAEHDHPFHFLRKRSHLERDDRDEVGVDKNSEIPRKEEADNSKIGSFGPVGSNDSINSINIINQSINSTSSLSTRQTLLLTRFEQIKLAVENHQNSVKLGGKSADATFLEHLQVTIPTISSEWRTLILNLPPHLECILCLDHATSIKLLIYCTQWLSGDISQPLSQWLFLLFIRLDNTLNHAEGSIVRDVAKKAIKLSTKLENEITPLTAYTFDMIITIVAVHFRQRDLLSCR